jgi:hypothetical protein
MKKSSKTGITGNESETTTMVGTQDSTVNTVDVSSPDKISEIPIDYSRIIELVDWFDSFRPENNTYEPNLKDLESTVNSISMRMRYFMKGVSDWFFESGQEMSSIYGSIYNDLMDTTNCILDGLSSLQDDKNIIGFDLDEVQDSIKRVNYNLSDCYEYLLKKKTKDNIYLKRFLLINLELEQLFNSINEKVCNGKVTKKFRNKIFEKVYVYQFKLSELLINVESILENKLSQSDRSLYNDLMSSIKCTRYLPTQLVDHIFLSVEKGFETVEMEFLEIFENNEFDLEDYISIETEESVLSN